MKRLIVYMDEAHFIGEHPADGETVEVVRGDGPREGEHMWFATVTILEDGGIQVPPVEPPPTA